MGIKPRLSAAVLGAVVSILAMTGCGGGEPATPAATPVPTPTPISVEELLRIAGEATGSLRTFHFRLDHEGGGTPLAPGLTVTEADGDVVSPGAISIDFAGTLGTFAVRSSLITIGDDSYMTNPLTDTWEGVPREVSPLGFFDPQKGIGSMMTSVQTPSIVSRGKDSFKLAGDLPVVALRPLLGNAVEGTTVSVELTIDARTRFLTKAVLDGRVTASEPDGVVRIIRLSEFNEPMDIRAPE